MNTPETPKTLRELACALRVMTGYQEADKLDAAADTWKADRQHEAFWRETVEKQGAELLRQDAELALLRKRLEEAERLLQKANERLTRLQNTGAGW